MYGHTYARYRRRRRHAFTRAAFSRFISPVIWPHWNFGESPIRMCTRFHIAIVFIRSLRLSANSIGTKSNYSTVINGLMVHIEQVLWLFLIRYRSIYWAFDRFATLSPPICSHMQSRKIQRQRKQQTKTKSRVLRHTHALESTENERKKEKNESNGKMVILFAVILSCMLTFRQYWP